MPITAERARQEIRESEIAMLDQSRDLESALWRINRAFGCIFDKNTEGARDEITRAVEILVEKVNRDELVKKALKFIATAIAALNEQAPNLEWAEGSLKQARKTLESVPRFELVRRLE